MPPLALIGLALAVMALAGVVLLGLVVGLAALVLISGDTALAGVRAGGVALGGMTEDEAARALSVWELALSEGAHTWRVPASDLGIFIDAQATAAAAVAYGRREGGVSAALRGALHSVDLAPILIIDGAALRAGLEALAPLVNTPPQDAGVRWENGALMPRLAVWGRALDPDSTAAAVQTNPAALADGVLELVTVQIPPAIADPTPIVEAARALVGAPLTLHAYDPVLDQTDVRTIPPEVWVNWLRTDADAALRLDRDALAGYLAAQPVSAGKLGAPRRLDVTAAAAALDAALADAMTSASTRLYYQPTQHIVQAGESITSIAWDYGIPYPFIEQANLGVSALSVGQALMIPPLDAQIPLPVVSGKRIVVSISEQRVRVYENGALRWDWAASTGIASSPTWSGVYQIISHEPNAYAGNWNLWMPNFMGVYRPVPGVDFTNGFHGFPTRSGGQLLWENDLGRRVTYGCILLSDANIAQLYTWAEAGVIVEIRA